MSEVSEAGPDANFTTGMANWMIGVVKKTIHNVSIKLPSFVADLLQKCCRQKQNRHGGDDFHVCAISLCGSEHPTLEVSLRVSVKVGYLHYVNMI